MNMAVINAFMQVECNAVENKAGEKSLASTRFEFCYS